MNLPNVLTLEETAAYLRLPEDIIEHEAQKGHLPGRQIAEQWRFLRIALDLWLSSHTGRTLLLQQAGMFADDPYLDDILVQIYQDRGRPESEYDQED